VPEVVIVGAGQAGLATSHELAERGVEHVVLERGRVGETWRGRWESFCLVTPNWSMQLPGQPYDGSDPDAFDHRDEIVGFLERYANRNDAPVEEGVQVTALDPLESEGLRLTTSRGELEADSVVLCTGAYQKPHRPPVAASLPADLLQIDVEDYSRPGALPEGPVLLVGSGQSGCQIAEELQEAGREVFLSCGRAPWVPRRIGEHDAVWWAKESGFLSTPVSALPDPSARLFGNVLISGRDGGHDLNLRTLRDKGVTLLGHFAGAEGRDARFLPDLEGSIEWGDERHRELRKLFTEFAAEQGISPPEMPDPEPLGVKPRELLDLRGFGAVIFSSGFRPDYRSWVNVAGGFDELGFPLHDEGASTAAPGLFFVGVHFLRTRKSSIFLGVGEDARIVAETIAAGSPQSAHA
jgi:putative flavoprotein involved in K+ transport